MFDFLLIPQTLPFSVALLLMVLIGTAEAIGIGASAAHIEADADGGGDWLGWLGVGEVPLLIVLVVLLALFGMIGIGMQQLAAALLGSPVSPWLAAPAALVAALPLTGICARALAHVMPGDETTAVTLDHLLGKRAEIVVGNARRGSPARGRVRDVHGQTHYVMIEPTDDTAVLGEGATALLVHREGELFLALPDLDPLLAPIEDAANPRKRNF
ncbi:MAG: OB-fold-containig protein [Pseudorhodoplanes sp.]